MTLAEMMTDFKVQIDKVDSFAVENFSPKEIVLFLNLAQDDFVNTRYSGNNPLMVGFEANQTRTDDLRILVKTNKYAVQLSDYNEDLGPKGVFVLTENKVTDNDGYLHTLSIQLGISKNNCQSPSKFTSNWATRVPLDKLALAYDDPYQRPNISKPIYTVGENFIELHINGNPGIGTMYDILFFHKYLRRAKKLSLFDPVQDCELPGYTHTQIVNLAVQKAMIAIQSTNNNMFNIQTQE